LASIEVYGIGSTSFSARLIGLQTSGVDYTRKCTWTVREKKSNNSVSSVIEYITQGETEGVSHTFSGLSANTDYVVSCTVYNYDTGAWLNSFSADVTTSGGTSPTWSLTEIDLGTLTSDYYTDLEFNLSPYHGYRYSFTVPYSGYLEVESWVCVDARVYISDNPSFNEVAGDPFFPDWECYDDGTYLRFGKLVEKNTTYYLFFRGFDETVSGFCGIGLQFQADESTTIAKWDWYSSNGSNASASDTINSYYALNKDEPTSDFSNDVWMDMVDKVDEITQASNYWDEDYASLYDTKNLPQNSDGLYELTAVAFNSLRNNIELVGLKLGMSKIPNATDGDNAVSGTIPHPVTSGRKVFAHYFLTLANYINSCIDNL
jgi:hypothetical protein